AVQIPGLNRNVTTIELLDLSGRIVQSAVINPGSTISWVDIRTLYAGSYVVRIVSGIDVISKTVVVQR
ncbi:MAG: T9SS type A sorting domain-containing protein, partial [Bacteroidota bacterium]